MKEWEYLGSDEYRDKVADSLYRNISDGDPPWLTDKEADGDVDDDVVANLDRLFFEDMVEEEEEQTGKHTGRTEDFEERDGKHKKD